MDGAGYLVVGARPPEERTDLAATFGSAQRQCSSIGSSTARDILLASHKLRSVDPKGTFVVSMKLIEERRKKVMHSARQLGPLQSRTDGPGDPDRLANYDNVPL